MQISKPITEESTTGFYLGVIGAALSLIGVLLSVYTLSSGEKSIWLGISGWIAALLLGTFLSIPLFRLINRLTEAHAANADLLIKITDLENANAKIIEIDAYIISKTVKQQATKRERKVVDRQAAVEANESLNETSAEEA
ncbi:hypothetical protein PZ739_12965 [Pseudomonas kermanshahensis]|uniref:hypothetical protein n=1 Tax=Pseudomonas kermanshahensis TaxID=2745482 RepID=UPI0023DCD2A4|nr:hypothetical protein [Pseudomonas kermanshahensis]WEL58022.1 hypothetical protein PZ739_12965 [Pseudomonas kermanshahensis]